MAVLKLVNLPAWFPIQQLVLLIIAEHRDESSQFALPRGALKLLLLSNQLDQWELRLPALQLVSSLPSSKLKGEQSS